MTLNESIVEDAALEWFLLRSALLNYGGQVGELGYAVGHGAAFAPGEYGGGTLTPALSQWERESYGESVLVGRLRETIRRLNPANACGIPHPASPTGRGEEAFARALHADRRAILANSASVQTRGEMTP
jgi:hypothetical protein